MKTWIYLGLGVGSLWLQLVLAPHLSVFGVKPNLMLLVLLVVGLRWIEPWLFIFAALMGLGLDVFSHGMLGVYGISFFVISFLARYVGFTVYENSAWFTMAAVAGLTFVEGLVSLTILEALEPKIPWWNLVLVGVLPVALYHALLAPFFHLILVRLEQISKLGEMGGVRL